MKLLACSQCLSGVDEAGSSSRRYIDTDTANPLIITKRPVVNNAVRKTSFAGKKSLPRVLRVLTAPWKSKRSKPKVSKIETRHKVKKRDLLKERTDEDTIFRCGKNGDVKSWRRISDESSKFYLEPLSPERIEKIKHLDGQKGEISGARETDELEDEYYKYLEALKFFTDPPSCFKDESDSKLNTLDFKLINTIAVTGESNVSESREVSFENKLSTLDFRKMNTVGLLSTEKSYLNFCDEPLDEIIQEHMKIEQAMINIFDKEPILKKKQSNKSYESPTATKKKEGKSVRFRVEAAPEVEDHEETVVNNLKFVQQEAEDLNRALARKKSLSIENILLETDFDFYEQIVASSGVEETIGTFLDFSLHTFE